MEARLRKGRSEGLEFELWRLELLVVDVGSLMGRGSVGGMGVLLVAGVVGEDILVLGSLEQGLVLVFVLEGLVTGAIEVAVDMPGEETGLAHWQRHEAVLRCFYNMASHTGSVGVT
jgi:ABC-type uncharacterized transport system permease subunit